jgi:hypothetical protein
MASALLAGALWASGASAISLPTINLAHEHPALPVGLNLGSLLLPGQIPDASLLGANPATVAYATQFGLGGGQNWDSLHNQFPPAASLNSVYLSGTNLRASAKFSLGRDLDFTVGHVALGLGPLNDEQPATFSRDLAERVGVNLLSAGTTSANLNWNFTDWASVAVTAAHSTGNALLLGYGGDTLGTGRASDSSALGISARADVAEGWVTTLTYSQGVTQLGLNRNAVVASADVRSDAYGIALAKNGLFGNDALGIALSRPLQIYPGNNLLNTNSALTGIQARESDVQLGYVTTFLDGTLALQANAAYQVNAAGARGENALVGVARAKLNF